MISAAAERAALAAVGRDLAALAGDGGSQRAAALLALTNPRRRSVDSASFAPLHAAPDWLRLDREGQRRIAHRAALLAMAPAIAASIDGEWLGDLARLAGEQDVDWAMAQSRSVPEGGLPAISADAVEASGFALMRQTLPEPLAPYLDWAEDSGLSGTATRSLAAFCLDRAAEETA